ncbi:hypothetical protein GCM10023084_01910 [Streptomyces lacrimifluminis]|uniref:Uncharacterized protein n=1 Tax=Streptomyces lacrimifluminis TaxID=1500077 RepID=A0A917NRI4_9ACTN|nr:hypothetical protein GCM10012282_16990 [Streptomyces lacrimifluminis]
MSGADGGNAADAEPDGPDVEPDGPDVEPDGPDVEPDGPDAELDGPDVEPDVLPVGELGRAVCASTFASAGMGPVP